MAQYEAVVASLLPDGKAEIVIRPDKPGIPDASEIAERVCHCATENSMIRTKAVNRAGALVGDLVAVQRNSAVVIKNILFLIGFPLVGAIIGVVMGSPLGGAAMAIIALAGASLGIMLGIRSYRRFSENNPLVIDHVIKSRDEFTAILAARAAAEGKDAAGCQAGCNSCTPWSS